MTYFIILKQFNNFLTIVLLIQYLLFCKISLITAMIVEHFAMLYVYLYWSSCIFGIAAISTHILNPDNQLSLENQFFFIWICIYIHSVKTFLRLIEEIECVLSLWCLRVVNCLQLFLYNLNIICFLYSYRKLINVSQNF